MKRGKLSPNKTWIAAAVLATGGNGEIHLPQHNASRRGPGLSYLRVHHARTGSKDATEKTRRKRATNINSHLGVISGGKEHVVAQMGTHHRKNRQLYDAISQKMPRKLDAHETGALFQHVSGNLGNQMRRHMR